MIDNKKPVFDILLNDFLHPPQSFSSLPSEQCRNRSQSKVEFMQVISPFSHLKPPSLHFQSPANYNNQYKKNVIIKLVSNKPHVSFVSSLPSMQSSSPSHTQSHGMHCRLLMEQLKLFLLQFASTGKVNNIITQKRAKRHKCS